MASVASGNSSVPPDLQTLDRVIREPPTCTFRLSRAREKTRPRARDAPRSTPAALSPGFPLPAPAPEPPDLLGDAPKADFRVAFRLNATKRGAGRGARYESRHEASAAQLVVYTTNCWSSNWGRPRPTRRVRALSEPSPSLLLHGNPTDRSGLTDRLTDCSHWAPSDCLPLTYQRGVLHPDRRSAGASWVLKRMGRVYNGTEFTE